MTEPSVNRWRRFGHDRLYVATPAGGNIGYWDLNADEGFPETPELRGTLADAVASWREGAGESPAVSAAVQLEPEPVQDPRTVELTERCGFPVAVSAVIAVVNADDFKVKQQPEGAHVTPRRELRRWLRKRPEVLDEGQANAIFNLARRSTTWVR